MHTRNLHFPVHVQQHHKRISHTMYVITNLYDNTCHKRLHSYDTQLGLHSVALSHGSVGKRLQQTDIQRTLSNVLATKDIHEA